MLDDGPREGRILTAPGLAEVLEAAAQGLSPVAIGRLAMRGHTGLLRQLRAGGMLVPHVAALPVARDTAAEARFVAVLDLRGARRAPMPRPDGRPLLLLVADHLDPALRPALLEAWSRHMTVLPVACRPGLLLAGPLAPPGHACLDCLLRRQDGLRPLAAALWRGLDGALPLPPAVDDLAQAPAPAARLAAALLDHAAPDLLSLVPDGATRVHAMRAGPGCVNCPAAASLPAHTDVPADLYAALAPWIDPETGLATPPVAATTVGAAVATTTVGAAVATTTVGAAVATTAGAAVAATTAGAAVAATTAGAAVAATTAGAAVAIRLSRPAIVQACNAFDLAIAHGMALCVGKAARPEEAALTAVAEAIERGALLHGPDPCIAQSLQGGAPLEVPRAAAVLAPVAGTRHDLDFEASGTAFGRNAEDATLRALLERIERDAAMIWWRRQARLPTFALPDAVRPLHSSVARQLGPDRAPPWLLDATTELGARVVVAVSVCLDGTMPVVGFGAGLDAGTASASALRELVAQAERLAGAMRQAEAAEAAASLLGWSLAEPAAHRLLWPEGGPRPPARPLAGSLAGLVDAVGAAGFEAFALCHAELWPQGPCVMRVLVPGLQGTSLSADDTPRLRSLPERLGWSCEPYGPLALNPRPFPG